MSINLSSVSLHVNLFQQYDEIFSKEIEEAWGSLCSRWENNIHEILGYLIALAGIIGSSEVLIHVRDHLLCIYGNLGHLNSKKNDQSAELKLQNYYNLISAQNIEILS